MYFHDEDGHLREIPAAWTNFVKGDAFVEIAAGRSQLHAGCLLELAEFGGRDEASEEAMMRNLNVAAYVTINAPISRKGYY